MGKPVFTKRFKKLYDGPEFNKELKIYTIKGMRRSEQGDALQNDEKLQPIKDWILSDFKMDEDTGVVTKKCRNGNYIPVGNYKNVIPIAQINFVIYPLWEIVSLIKLGRIAQYAQFKTGNPSDLTRWNLLFPQKSDDWKVNLKSTLKATHPEMSA